MIIPETDTRYFQERSLAPHKGVLFVVPVLCGDKCLGGNTKFLISKHSHDFLFFLTGVQEYSV
jgi:hypothetical protein